MLPGFYHGILVSLSIVTGDRIYKRWSLQRLLIRIDDDSSDSLQMSNTNSDRRKQESQTNKTHAKLQ